MELGQLRCFVAVAEELHFGRAARRVHLTVSPVSRSIRELERELGGDLFVRGYHRVELTRLGTRLLPMARRILEDTDQMLSVAVSLVPERRPAPLRLGISTLCPPVASESVVDLLRRVLGDDRVDIQVAPAAELLPQVEDGALDLVLVQLPIGRRHLSSIVLARLVTWVVMRTDDPFATRQSMRLSELAGRRLILGSSRVEPVAMETMIANLHAHGVLDLAEMAEFDHVKLAAQIRHRGGLALTLHPDTGGSARIFDDASFLLVPLNDTDFRFPLGAAWRRDNLDRNDQLSRAVEALRHRWTPPAGLV